jgi:hypothetical protein
MPMSRRSLVSARSTSLTFGAACVCLASVSWRKSAIGWVAGNKAGASGIKPLLAPMVGRFELRSVEDCDMGRQTKLTASQHDEIRAAVREREFLVKHIAELKQKITQTKHRIDRLTIKQLGHRYGVNPRTIERVLSGEPYGSVKPEPASSHS